jgi:hypothetical protein
MTAALALIALASAIITWRLRRREQRRIGAEDALDALARYSEWLAAQRRNAGFQGDRPPGASPLVQLRRLQQGTFPELAAPMARLLEVHAQVLDFLWKQQLLRVRDPEAWLETDHDDLFMALWREHRAAVHQLADLLRDHAGELMVDADPESVFPA